MPELEQLASFVLRPSGHLPPTALRAARRVLLDSVGAILAGTTTDAVAHLLDDLAPPAGAATLIGRDRTAWPAYAAFVNGTAMVSLELDEGNQWSRGHPAAHVVPAALAAAEEAHAGGAALLEAIAYGYEVAARFGRASSLRPDVHTHGTAGNAGAAAAVARLRALDADSTAAAMRLAVALSTPTAWDTALRGDLVRNLYMGRAGAVGVLAPALVGAGFGAGPDAERHVLGRILGSAFDPGALVEGLGGQWEIERNYFKFYAFCRYAHSPIQAAFDLTAAEAIAPEEVEAVEVRTFARASTLGRTDPDNMLAAKFSIPYAVGSVLVRGRADQSAFSAEAMADPRVRALARRVRLVDEPDHDSRYPDQMVATVTVRLADGRVVERTCSEAKGSPNRPPSDEELAEKFRSLAAYALAGRAEEALALVRQLEAADDVAETMGRLRVLCRHERS